MKLHQKFSQIIWGSASKWTSIALWESIKFLKKIFEVSGVAFSRIMFLAQYDPDVGAVSFIKKHLKRLALLPKT